MVINNVRSLLIVIIIIIVIITFIVVVFFFIVFFFVVFIVIVVIIFDFESRPIDGIIGLAMISVIPSHISTGTSDEFTNDNTTNNPQYIIGIAFTKYVVPIP